MQKFYAIDDDLFEERESLTCFKRTILAVYKADDTDQELARLRERVGELEAKAERLQMDANGTDWLGSLYAKGLEVNLLKAALRWLFSNDARRGGSRAVVCLSVDGRFVYSGGADKDIPPEFAPLIAEAVKP